MALCGIVLGLTGCGSNGSKGIEGDVLGTYNMESTSAITVTEDTTVKKTTVIVKEKTIVDANNEETVIYDIKDIESHGDDKYNFNLYDGETKKAECHTSFGSISCKSSNGGVIFFNKK